MDEDKTARMQAQLQAMCEAYAAQLPEKIAQIVETWSVLRHDWSDEKFVALHRMVHGLTGSGATFGFSRLSDAARTLEVLLKGLIAEGKAPLSRRQCEDVERYLKALQDVSLKADEKIPPGKAASPSDEAAKR